MTVTEEGPEGQLLVKTQDKEKCASITKMILFVSFVFNVEIEMQLNWTPLVRVPRNNRRNNQYEKLQNACWTNEYACKEKYCPACPAARTPPTLKLSEEEEPRGDNRTERGRTGEECTPFASEPHQDTPSTLERLNFFFFHSHFSTALRLLTKIRLRASDKLKHIKTW